jgi:hypothetical protein
VKRLLVCSSVGERFERVIRLKRGYVSVARKEASAALGLDSRLPNVGDKGVKTEMYQSVTDRVQRACNPIFLPNRRSDAQLVRSQRPSHRPNKMLNPLEQMYGYMLE